VLHKTRHSESSLIVDFLTPDRGRLVCLAKGARRMKSAFGDSLSLFAEVEIVYYYRPGRSIQIVTEADLLRFPWGIRRSPVRYLYARSLASLVLGAVSGEEPDPDLYGTVAEGMYLVDRVNAERLHTLWWSLQLKILERLGYKPLLERCLVCGRRAGTVPMLFSPGRGGVVCPTHGGKTGEAVPVSPGTVRLMRRLQDTPLGKSVRYRAGSQIRRELDESLAVFSRYHLGIVAPAFPPGVEVGAR